MPEADDERRAVCLDRRRFASASEFKDDDPARWAAQDQGRWKSGVPSPYGGKGRTHARY